MSTRTLSAAQPAPTLARIIPFPPTRIVRLTRAPRRTAAQRADDDAFTAGYKLAIDVIGKLRRGQR